MASIEVTRTVAAPPEAVFDRASDFARTPEYVSAITHVEVLTDGPVGVGTRFRETRKVFGKEASEVMEVAEFERPERYVLFAQSHGSRYRTELRFLAVPGGTEVTMHFEATPVHVVAKLLSFLMKPLLRTLARQCARDLDELAASFAHGDAAPA